MVMGGSFGRAWRQGSAKYAMGFIAGVVEIAHIVMVVVSWVDLGVHHRFYGI
jgi:hypothetical protein